MENEEATIRILTLNIASPSDEKAARQLEWLNDRTDDLLVLTETGIGDGTRMLANAFRSAGYHVIFQAPTAGDRGVLIASRFAQTSRHPVTLTDWPSRLAGVRLEFENQALDVFGIYVPSRDASPGKIERKQRFIRQTTELLSLGKRKKRTIITGDFNVLEREHVPRYPFFESWEYEFYEALKSIGHDAFRLKNGQLLDYSWVGRTGDGYRYDHAFISSDLGPHVSLCRYDHHPRQTRISDHSSLEVTIAGLKCKERLSVTPLLQQRSLF